jgi:predicted Fe-Mo cluster-binding NifX family protein
MSKIGFVTALDRTTTRLSPHFGKAKWVMILDNNSGKTSFIRNTGLTGRAVVDILLSEGCEEVVFRNIGPGALKQLKAADIGAWRAVQDKVVLKLAGDLLRGQLRLASKPSEFPGGQSGMKRTKNMEHKRRRV